MAGIEAAQIFCLIVFGGGSYLGTDNRLEYPYKTFQNSYLQIHIKLNRNNDSDSLKSRVHKANFRLKVGNSGLIDGGNLKYYDLYIPRSKDLEEKIKTIQENFKLYYLEDCIYTERLPTNAYFAIHDGFLKI